ncbi:hypothetical protein N7522_005852, partial [Penicillium canescens]
DCYLTKSSRKTHKKSRLGCANCKRRKIKCDEVKPECTHCVRHSITCDYTMQDELLLQVQSDASSTDSQKEFQLQSRQSEPQNPYSFISSSATNFRPPKRRHEKAGQSKGAVNLNRAPPEPSYTPIPETPFQFSGADMELFHHYMIFTSMTLAEDEPGRQLMQTTLPQLGFKFNYVLRLLLAFSAYHNAYLKRQQQRREVLPSKASAESTIMTQGDHHYTTAVREVSNSIPSLSETSCHAVYASAVFICFCSFAKGPSAGEFLVFNYDKGNAEWLSLLGGVRSIVEHSRDVLSVDLISSHASNSSSTRPLFESFEDQNDIHTGWRSCYEHLQTILCLGISTDDFRYPIYHRALDGLAWSFDKVYSGTVTSKGENWALIFRWLYTLPEIFASDLQQREPLALLLFSPFVVLLKELEAYWFVRGWPEHIVSGVYQYLNVEQRASIRWQMERVGWNPPDECSEAEPPSN